MQNIELKVILDDDKHIVKAIKRIGARFKLKMYQVDTYYNCKKGHLKIREINNKYFELIFYQRPDRRSSKISNYFLLKMKLDQLEIMKNILRKVLGEKNVIKKVRNLWIYKNTRIHIDKITGLGSFLELETVVRKNGLKYARKEHNKIIKLLSLSNFKKVSKSYGDLKS